MLFKTDFLRVIRLPFLGFTLLLLLLLLVVVVVAVVVVVVSFFLFLLWRCGPTRSIASSFTRFLDHTQRRTAVGRTPLDEWSVRRRDLYLTTRNTDNRQTSMPPVGFEPTNSVSERPQTYALDRAATGTGSSSSIISIKIVQNSVR